ncbi:MAG: hypothetical protein RLZZ546_3346, partial [Bacteroidota bacterium]
MKWGIIGLGKIAHTFAKEFAFVDDSKIVMAGSRDTTKAKEFAQLFHIENYGNYDDVIFSERVEVVYISTPHHLHF